MSSLIRRQRRPLPLNNPDDYALSLLPFVYREETVCIVRWNPPFVSLSHH